MVARPIGDTAAADITYQTLRVNVDILKIIQLGLSFTDGEGNWAEGCTCWQFNFKFHPDFDISAHDSIELLKSSGIDFAKFNELGIEIPEFGELMMMSGLVLNDDVKWVSFHSSYDFGYLLRTLTCTDLPLEEAQFMELLRTYFPCIYDVKFMMTAAEGLHGGLSTLGDTLQVQRIGPMHQAGSDSLLTAQTFFALINKFLGGHLDDTKFRGEMFGLGTNHTKYKNRAYMPSGNGLQDAVAGGGGGGGGSVIQSSRGGGLGSTHGSAQNLYGYGGGGYGGGGLTHSYSSGYINAYHDDAQGVDTY